MLNLDSKLCCGCSACVQACPRGCLSMIENSEGFAYPKLTNPQACIECNLCSKVCPVLASPEETYCDQHGYILQHRQDAVRFESTSGGAFSAIAHTVLQAGGIVYGAAFNEKCSVVHIPVTNETDLWRLRGSKYVQSDLQNAFQDIRNFLNSGRTVCFSGTPCQIEGLLSFLGKRYDNLLLVDVVCHGISSPLIWRKYLELQASHLPANIYFRWKHYGYKYSTMSFFSGGKETYFSGVETDPMLRAYFSNSCNRLSCYSCPFKKRYRVSDITIWDCFHPKFFDPQFDDDAGTTSVLTHTQKGYDILKQITGTDLVRYKEINPDILVHGVNEMVRSVSCGKNRSAIFSDAQLLTASELFSRHFPNVFQAKIKKFIRLILLNLHLYKPIQYILFLVRRYRHR